MITSELERIKKCQKLDAVFTDLGERAPGYLDTPGLLAPQVDGSFSRQFASVTIQKLTSVPGLCFEYQAVDKPHRTYLLKDEQAGWVPGYPVPELHVIESRGLSNHTLASEAQAQCSSLSTI